MIKNSTLLHLRIPFSLFLLPFFLFALTGAPHIDVFKSLLAAFVIHLVFYPATNGYNSYYDKDEQSIGGLKNPPKVDKELYFVSLLLDVLALALGLFISVPFTLLLLLIGFASKAYSHPLVRLKKYPFLGLFTVAFFQGAYTYVLSMAAIDPPSLHNPGNPDLYIPAALCSLILLGSYPMTQIYQHEEDGKRGDRTISLLLGIRGTFCWTAGIFGITLFGFFVYLNERYGWFSFILLLLCLTPVLLFFTKWLIQSWHHPERVNYDRTMKLNKYSSLGFIAFFLILLLIKYYNLPYHAGNF